MRVPTTYIHVTYQGSRGLDPGAPAVEAGVLDPALHLAAVAGRAGELEHNPPVLQAAWLKGVLLLGVLPGARVLHVVLLNLPQ